MKETKYAYAAAYTRTLENKMLTKSDLEVLINMPSADAVLKHLADSGYGGGIGDILKNELKHVWNEVKFACPEGAPIDILLYQNDFHNLKSILKAVFSRIPYEALMLEPYTIEPKIIYDAISTGKLENLPGILQKSAAEAFNILARSNDGQLAEIVLDKAVFLLMAKTAEQSKDTFLIDWVDLCTAILNMKIALRGAYSGRSREFLNSAMLPCAKISLEALLDAAAHGVPAVLNVFEHSGFEGSSAAALKSVSEFEKWCDNRQMDYLKAVRYKPLGFEPLLGFLVGKQVELQSIRIILSGLGNGISTEILRERLRDLYV